MADDYVDTVVCDDNMNLMAQMQDDSVDLIVTDPPFGIGFMGKSWDKAVPPVDVWRECLRVLKPGGWAFVMCIPRQDCQSRMIVNLQDAGFDVSFTPIYWTFAQGFPKAMSISKAVDRRLGVEGKIIGQASIIGDYKRQKQYDQGYRDKSEIPYRGEREGAFIRAPASPEAKALDGAYAGFQPKPAVEVVLVAMKPLSEKTYIDQALKNGKGVTWLEECKIPYESEDDRKNSMLGEKSTWCKGKPQGMIEFMGSKEWTEYQPQNGRFPANILVSDDVLNDGMERTSGSMKTHRRANRAGFTGPMPEMALGHNGYSVSFSRYFSLDEWAQKHLPESVLRTFPFLLVPKASKSEKNAGLDELPDKQMYKCDSSGNSLEIFGTTDGGRLPRKNAHPTVKPVKLMAYLITMGSRPGDVVFDPYLGSGTTAVAAVTLKRHWIGCDIDPVSCQTAELRVKYTEDEIAKEERKQLDLFVEAAGD